MGFPILLDLQLEQATLLKNALEALSDLFSEANFDFSGKGCEIQAVDTNRVALVRLLLPRELFKEYSCCDRGLSISLNLADMAEVFRCVNNDDSITIKAELDLSYTVTFTFESPGDGDVWSFDFHFKLDIHGMPFKIPDPPESEYQAIVRMPSAKFMRICKKLSSSGGRDTDVIISVEKGDKEGVSFFADGKNGNSTIFCSQTRTVGEPKESVVIDMKEEVSLIFDLWYMNSFSKVSTLSDEVTICLSSDWIKKPPVFEYKISGMCYIRYYLSPKAEMQNEGDEMQN